MSFFHKIEKPTTLRRVWFFWRCFFNAPISCKSLHSKGFCIFFNKIKNSSFYNHCKWLAIWSSVNFQIVHCPFFCNSVFHYWRSETPWVGLRPPGLRNVTIFLPIWNIQLVAELCVYIGTHFSWLLLLTFSLALFCLLCKQHN